MSQMWEDVSFLLSGRLIKFGCMEGLLFVVGVLSMMKMAIAPVLATACDGFISMAPACWALVQLDARTVTSLLSSRLTVAVAKEEYSCVGSNE